MLNRYSQGETLVTHCFSGENIGYLFELEPMKLLVRVTFSGFPMGFFRCGIENQTKISHHISLFKQRFVQLWCLVQFRKTKNIEKQKEEERYYYVN